MAGLEIKKLVRSMQVFFPWLPDAKFAAHYRYHRAAGRLFQAEYAGLAAFDWDEPLLLDIGANRGQSIVAFQNALPRCRVVAFEPTPRLAATLIGRYRDDANVRIETCALASKAGSFKLYIPSYNGYLFDGLASIYRSEAETWLNSERLYWFDPRKVTVQEIEVPTRTLDSYDFAPVLLKLNVQRAEIEVLNGAKTMLVRHRPVILSAYPWEALIRMLAEFGYRTYSYRDGCFNAGELGRRFTWFLLDHHAEAVAAKIDRRR